jgi:hypothetical protein
VCRPYAKKIITEFDKEVEHLIRVDRPAYFENLFRKFEWNGTVTTQEPKELYSHIGELCVNELKIKQMNKKGHKYEPDTEDDSYDLDIDFFVNKTKEELTKSFLAEVNYLCKDPWSMEVKSQARQAEATMMNSYSMNEAVKVLDPRNDGPGISYEEPSAFMA